jgi:hypothetical protein
MPGGLPKPHNSIWNPEVRRVIAPHGPQWDDVANGNMRIIRILPER